MPKLSLDKTAAVKIIASLVSSSSEEQIQLQNDHLQLDSKVVTQHFPWQVAADALGVTKTKLYHWYQDTFQRQIQDQFTTEDSILLRSLIRASLRKGAEPVREEIAPRLSREYHHKVLKVAFRNALTLAKQELRQNRSTDSSLVQEESVAVQQDVQQDEAQTHAAEEESFVFMLFE